MSGRALARARTALEPAGARANRWTADGEPLRLRLDADGETVAVPRGGRPVDTRRRVARDPATALASAARAAGADDRPRPRRDRRPRSVPATCPRVLVALIGSGG
ncbi:hypothetical protein GCM10010240_56480 [Streptomyces griseoviridis]|nr:hypothetical protein GCM10010240_56480 [Streptomyces griseoviridis]